ncbi:hypothetical protein K488DRAFT_75045 [Vararia minispora EC-137]|uniref:Uncharacterized protein n=1 Tax=Vararia minispora EC-137 TaxID=1314806 RepID=A0ACB8Q575_9AGAM|nr:hypothetical protein K488DRAFT_75045 [Vararia minispora EC-137]
MHRAVPPSRPSTTRPMQASTEDTDDVVAPAALWASLPPHVRQAFLQLVPQDNAANAAASCDESQPRGTVRPREEPMDADERPRQRRREAQSVGGWIPTHDDSLQHTAGDLFWDKGPEMSPVFPGMSQQRQMLFLQGPEEEEEGFGDGWRTNAVPPHGSQHSVQHAPASRTLGFAPPASRAPPGFAPPASRTPGIAPPTSRAPGLALPASHASSMAPPASRASSVAPPTSRASSVAPPAPRAAFILWTQSPSPVSPDLYANTDSSAMWRIALLKRAKLQQHALTRAGAEGQSEESDTEMEEFDQALAAAAGTPGEDSLPDLASIKTTELNTNEKRARHKVMEAFRLSFRDLAGIGVGKPWVSWDGEDQVESQARPGKKDWRPNFQQGVKDKINLTMIQQTASIVLPTLKITYQGFKQEYARQQSPEGQERREFDNQRNLRRQRCHIKAVQRRLACPVFAERYGIDPMALIETDWMSNEVSCAEGKTMSDIAALRAWRRKVGAAIFKNGEEAMKTRFFATLQSPWRAKQYGDVCIVLSDIYAESRVGARQKGQHARRIRVKRASTRVPLLTPFCWQINQQFYDEHKDDEELKFILCDWNRRTNPPGWDGPLPDLPVPDDGKEADDEDEGDSDAEA